MYKDNYMEWKERYERMKIHYRWTDSTVAEITGNTHGSVRTVLNRPDFPRWLRLAVIVFEKENGLESN